eukprot:scaffold119495_cov48-Attheya_sp.AAC.3
MNVVLKHFASNVLLVNTPDQAKDLYYEAAMVPCSATQVVLQEQNGISVAEIFEDQRSIQHELEVWNAVADYNERNSTHLVPLRQLEFESAQLEISDIFSGAHYSVGYPNTNTHSGVLMTHYQGTLTKCKMPLTEELFQDILCDTLVRCCPVNKNVEDRIDVVFVEYQFEAVA